MEVKGIVAKSIAEFIKANYSEHYTEWESSLPMETLAILEKRISLHLWHSVEFGAEKPTIALANMFFDGDVQKAAFNSGRYSAERAFNGVFKMLLIFMSPQMLIQKAPRLFGTFYKPSTTLITKHASNHITMVVKDMEKHSEIIEYRITGWVQRALEMSNSSDVHVDIIKSFAKGDDFTEFDIHWH
jgi:hypothetical protein